jgi:hypothetical protein
MKELSINGKYICHLPEKWNELTAEQLLTLCRLVYTSYGRDSLLVQLLLTFSGLRFSENQNPVYVDGIPCWFLYHRQTKVALISVEDLVFAASPLEFVFTEHKDKYIIESNLFVNKLREIKIGNETFHGPDSALYNIRFAEFIRLETLYEQFSKKHDPSILDSIIAVLYRVADPENPMDSPRFTGDVRIPFNDHLLDANKKVVSRMKPEYKLAVRLFYEGCRWFIFKGCNLFKNAFSSQASASGAPAMAEYMKLVTALSNDDASKMEQIRQTLAWDIFHQLETLAARNKELKNKMKNV